MRITDTVRASSEVNGEGGNVKGTAAAAAVIGQKDCGDSRDSRTAGSDGFDVDVFCERFGPEEHAGTFEMATCDADVPRSKSKSLVEFAVWRKSAISGGGCDPGRVLWFTVRKEMEPAAAIAIRALEVWTDRDNRYPSKVVLLLE